MWSHLLPQSPRLCLCAGVCVRACTGGGVLSEKGLGVCVVVIEACGSACVCGEGVLYFSTSCFDALPDHLIRDIKWQLKIS